MQYLSTLITVKDMEASKAFYTGLLGMSVTFDLGANVVLDDRLALQTLDTWADFLDTTPAAITFGSNAYELYFEAEDIDAFMAKLDAEWPQVKVPQRLKQFPWGQRSTKLLDPDGHMVEIGESMKTVVKNLLRAGCTNEEAQQRSQYPLPFVQMCRAELEEEGR